MMCGDPTERRDHVAGEAVDDVYVAECKLHTGQKGHDGDVCKEVVHLKNLRLNQTPARVRRVSMMPNRS